MTAARRGRVGLVGLERGRVLPLSLVGGRPGAAGIGTAGGLQQHAGILLLLTLPLFGQLFHYLIDVGPIYYLSKAWPFLTLPLAAYAIFRVSTPFHTLYMVTIAYALGVTPVLSMVWLGNDIVEAFTTTIKVWPLTYYFSMLAVLVVLKPSPTLITRTILQLGIATYVIMWILWIVVPVSFYASDSTISKLFMFENERGYRIYMPVTFGIIMLFYLASRMAERPRLWIVLSSIAMLGSLVYIYKQRLAIFTTIIVIGWTFVARLPLLARSIFVLLGAGIGGAMAIAALANLDRITESLGASLSVRQHSMALVTQYLVNEPLRWIFGVGGTTRFANTTLSEIMGSASFYLADLGWLGVLFEYGLVGSLMILSLYIVIVRLPATVEWGDEKDAAMTNALRAYVLYLLLTSSIYSAVFVPGELAAISALFLYMRRGPGAEPRSP